MKIDANRIRSLREARGWSQEHLAAVAGLSPRTVQRLEAEGKAAHESRMAVAAALGIEPTQLAGFQAAAPVPTSGIGAADRIKITLWIVSIVLAVIMFQGVAGYVLGKNAAKRDNRIDEACKAAPASCDR
ncbi:helix-turn-helix transcriptional regulator [Stenotrophomonas sp. CW117]|nr:MULTISPECIES: helix-turn-helix transcriptional regulator [Stenotrophomonas]QOG00378.1 helix-turn-helix transcriptional regulator [Stenotrophomonas sp. CW117]